MCIFRTLIFSLLSFGLAGYGQATLLWDEATSGDLPAIYQVDQILPDLVLHEGVNEIRGAASWSGIFVQGEYRGAFDADHARLTLLPGLQIDLIDYVFSNVSLLQLANPFSPGVRLRQGYALTNGRYAVDDVLFYKFWDFSDAVGEEVPTPVGSFDLLPVTEPGNNYLFGSWSGGASLPTEWNYSWDYIASITVKRTSVVPVSNPGILGLFIIALMGMIHTRVSSRLTTRRLPDCGDSLG